MDEILWCDHSNDTSSTVLSHDAICFSEFYKVKFGNVYLNVDSGRFGSEMVKLPEQKSHVEQKSKSSLDFHFKYESIRRWARHFRCLRSTQCLHGLLCGLKQKLHNINHCLRSFLSNGYCIWTLSTGYILWNFRDFNIVPHTIYVGAANGARKWS